jgi:transcriptional regulator with XRE-family HTH domain
VSAGEARIEAELERIGQRVRKWRDEAGLTLQALAERSGLATSTIQKIETNAMTPSVAVLLKLARGLGRRPADLVRDDADEAACIHLRAAERHPIGKPGVLVMERLSGDLVDPVLETWRATVYPGHGGGRRPIRFDGEALVVCEEGSITFAVGEEEHVLGPGDVLHWKAELPHTWRNDGSAPARFTLTGTLPRALRAAMQRRLRR